MKVSLTNRPKDDGIVDRVALERALAGDREVFLRLTSRELRVLTRHAPRRLEELYELHEIEPEVELRYAPTHPVSVNAALGAAFAVQDGATKVSVAASIGVSRPTLDRLIGEIGVAA